MAKLNQVLLEKITPEVYTNFDLFKEYYYKNLFAVLYNFKMMYGINDMDAIEDLQNKISDVIQENKKQVLSKG